MVWRWREDLICKCIREENDKLHIHHFELLVGPIYGCFYIVKTVVLPEVVRPYSFFSGASSKVFAFVLDDVEKAVTESVVFLKGNESAWESLSKVTRSVVQSNLDVEASGMTVLPSAVPGPSVVADFFCRLMWMRWGLRWSG